jgi:hypothetical protein
MWEALLALRLIASVRQTVLIGHCTRIAAPALTADRSEGAIRLSFAAYRLSLPLTGVAKTAGNHDQKIA